MTSLVLPLAPRRSSRVRARAPGDARPAEATQRQPQSADTAATSAGAPSPRSTFVMLIVDDDPLMTDMLPRRLRRVLRDEVAIHTAATPDEAAELIHALRPDAILSDYNLRHDRNGLDVLRLAEDQVPSAVRILFSGHTPREIRGLDDAAIHAYVEKPMKLDELIAPVLEAIERATGEDLRGGGPRG